MTLRVSGKNLDIGESLRTYVGARIDSILARHSDEPASGHVTLEREGAGFRTDCTLRCRSAIVQVEAGAHGPYASFNKAAERVEKRLKKLKHKQRDRGDGVVPFAGSLNPASPWANFASPEGAKKMDCLLIAEPLANLKEMSVSGAVRDLDSGNAPVLVFRHAGDGHTNIVYRRRDGHIGWIDATQTATRIPL